MVHAADTNAMLVITQLQPIAVDLHPAGRQSAGRLPAHAAGSTLAVEAYSRDDQTKLATGTLLTIDNQIDQTTGTATSEGDVRQQG